MRIKFLKEWTGPDATVFAAGSFGEVDEAGAKSLVADGIAEIVVEAPTVKAAPPAQTEPDIATQVKAAVDEALKAAQPKPTSPAITVHENVDDDPKKGFKSFGEFITSVKAAGTPGGTLDKRLLVTKAPTGLGVSVDSDGGFLIPEGFSASLMEKAYSITPLVNLCTRIPMSGMESIKIPYVNETSRADGSRQGGVRVYRKAEAAALSASHPTFGQVRLELKKLIGACYDTEELLKWSAVTVDSMLTTMFANEFAFAIQKELILGTGAGEMLGVMKAPCLVTVAKDAGQPADTITNTNIENMWSRLYGPCRSNAVWLINQDCEGQLSQLSMPIGAGGYPLYLPAGGLSATPYSTLKGRPVFPIEQCDTLGDLGDIILADFSQYLYAEDAAGITGRTSIHVQFLYGETVMRWVMFNDGQPWWPAALTPYLSSNTLSPFVTLAERA